MTAGLDPEERARRIEAAARWIVDNPDHPRPTVPVLLERFDLSITASVQAIRRADEIRAAKSGQA